MGKFCGTEVESFEENPSLAPFTGDLRRHQQHVHVAVHVEGSVRIRTEQHGELQVNLLAGPSTLHWAFAASSLPLGCPAWPLQTSI